MHNYKFELNKKQDITDYILEFNYSEDLNDVASPFDFTSLENFGLTENEKTNTIDITDRYTGEHVYHGYILENERQKDKNVYSYTGFDAGYYLNNNEIVKQARNDAVGQFIVTICGENDINLKTKTVNGKEVKNIPPFTSRIAKMYKGEIFGEVLKELIQYEKDYGSLKDVYIDCKHGYLDFPQYTIEPTLQGIITNNIAIDSTKTIKDVSFKRSIKDLKTRVAYTTNNDKDEFKKYYPENYKSDSYCKKYGVLTSVHKVESLNASDIKDTMENKLKELFVEKQHIELSLIGDYRFQKGKYITLPIKEYSITGDFLISNVSHKITREYEDVTLKFDKYINLKNQ